MPPLKLKLVGPKPGEPKFYQKYFVIKRDRLAELLRGLADVIDPGAVVHDENISHLTKVLDGMMDIQGASYFVVNLDEIEGQEAMIKYWELKGHTRDEVLSCIPDILKKGVGNGKGKAEAGSEAKQG